MYLYVLLAGLWVLALDLVMHMLLDPSWESDVSDIGTLAAVAFVLISGGLLLLIVSRYKAKLDELADRLTANEQRSRSFAEVASDWFWETDQNFRLVYVSERFAETTGGDVRYLLGKSPGELPGWVPDELEKHLSVLRQGRPFRDLVRRWTTPDGSEVHVRISGTPILNDDGKLVGYRGVGTDCTAEFLAKTEAEQAHTRLIEAIDAIPEGFCLFDASDRLVLCNRKYHEIYKISSDVLEPGTRFEEIIRVGVSRGQYPDAIGREDEWIAERLAARREARGGFEQRLPDDRWVKVEERLTRDGGKVGIRIDITEIKATADRLRQGERLEAVGQLTGGVAHDFNNLLTVISGNAEVLVGALHDGGREQRMAASILKAGQRAGWLTQQLLAFSRKQPLKLVDTDANARAGAAIDLLKRTIGENIVIERRLAPDLWRATTDESQLETALLNLAINARDAMPDGGTLTFETANVHLDEEYARIRSDVVPGEYVMVAVSDTGTGIAASEFSKIFEPFYTTKESGKGTGLGLSMVYGFVRQIGGHIAVSSELGLGTAFRIYLRRHIGEPVAVAEAYSSAALIGGSETILVVEDDALVRDYVAGQLDALGYTVLEADCSAAALDTLSRHREISLMLTDVVMPGGLSGPRLAEEARRRNPDLKVIFSSGYGEHATMEQAGLPGDAPLLIKPYRRRELAQAIRQPLDAPGSTSSASPQGEPYASEAAGELR